MKTNGTSLAAIIAESGPMEERKAMGIARVLCGRLIEEAAAEESALPAFHPQTILLSPDGTLSFSRESVPEQAREAYLPPEYAKGFTSKESVLIYSIGMLLLFLVTGRETKSAMNTGIRNRVLRETINRCTALDSRQRFKSLMEVRSALGRELIFPKKGMFIALATLALFLAAALSVQMFLRGRAGGNSSGTAVGYQNGYRDGYEAGTSDAPGIGIENIELPGQYGNLSGNLNSEQGAFAAAGGGYVFYADSGRVYRMDPYNEHTVLLSEHETACGLNYWEEYLYYLTEDAIVRMNLKNGTEETVNSSLWGRFCICDGMLYVDDEKSSGYLYSIDLKTLEAKQLNGRKEFAYLNLSGGSLFYADPDSGSYLFRSDYDGGNDSRLLGRPCKDISLCQEKLYCLTTGDQDSGSTCILTGMDHTGQDVEILTAMPVSRFVAGENGLFYISSETGFLEWMTPDGKTRYTVSASAVSDFNLAERWIFYRAGGDNALYRMRLDGSDSVRLS